jgi:hypothetical protein
MKYIIIFLVFTQFILAQSTKYGGSFLEIGVGARALGMGSAQVACAEDGSAFYWNPGGIASLGRIQFSGMYADLFNSLENHGFASISLPVFGGAMISASWIRLAVEDIPRYNDADLIRNPDERINDPDGAGLTDPSTGTFAYADNAYIITLAKLNRINADLGWQYFEFPIDLAYGVNFKMIDTYLDDNKASGLGVDAGVKLSFGLDDVFDDDRMGKLFFGINVQDIFNTTIKWDTDTKQQDEIERNWKYGFALSQPLIFMDSQMLLAFDLNSKYTGSAHFGVEIKYKSLFAVRLGNNSSNFTAGAGISYWQFNIDYAYQNHELGNSHRVEFGVFL